MISCILLSAGLSKRFGSPKALVQVKNSTLIQNLQKILIDSNLGEIVIVLGANAELIRPFILKHNKVNVVYNKDYYFGQTSSFKIGLKNIYPEAQGVMLLPVDFPCIRKETVDHLIQIFLKKQPFILIPSFYDQKGHPPIFHTKLRKEIESLDNSLGMNQVVKAHADEVAVCPVDDKGVISSFNTKEEFEKIKNEFDL